MDSLLVFLLVFLAAKAENNCLPKDQCSAELSSKSCLGLPSLKACLKTYCANADYKSVQDQCNKLDVKNVTSEFSNKIKGQCQSNKQSVPTTQTGVSIGNATVTSQNDKTSPNSVGIQAALTTQPTANTTLTSANTTLTNNTAVGKIKRSLTDGCLSEENDVVQASDINTFYQKFDVYTKCQISSCPGINKTVEDFAKFQVFSYTSSVNECKPCENGANAMELTILMLGITAIIHVF